MKVVHRLYKERPVKSRIIDHNDSGYLVGLQIQAEDEYDYKWLEVVHGQVKKKSLIPFAIIMWGDLQGLLKSEEQVALSKIKNRLLAVHLNTPTSDPIGTQQVVEITTFADKNRRFLVQTDSPGKATTAVHDIIQQYPLYATLREDGLFEVTTTELGTEE